jgi:threonine dehydrogenase-like Zn-dependent dehydrogenase
MTSQEKNMTGFDITELSALEILDSRGQVDQGHHDHDWPGGRSLLRLLTSHEVDAGRFVTHHFALDDFTEAYDVFAYAADTGALKVVLSR